MDWRIEDTEGCAHAQQLRRPQRRRLDRSKRGELERGELRDGHCEVARLWPQHLADVEERAGSIKSLRSNLREPSARWVFGGARCRACPPPPARLIVDALRMMSEAGADSCR